jgi:RNA polymerase sigma factor (sigma-70 family)
MSKAMSEDASTAGRGGNSATPPRCDASAAAGNNSPRDDEVGAPPYAGADAAVSHRSALGGAGGPPGGGPPSRFDTDVDSRLLADLLLGDRHAVRVFAERMRPVVATAARRAPLDIRSDAIQDVWLFLWDRNFMVLQKWKRSGPLAHYVLIVARNRVFDFLRRYRDDLRRRGGAQGWTIDEALRCPDELVDHNSPEQQVLEFERDRCMERAKASLSDAHRQVIALRYDRNLKLREIAEQLGRSIGAVSVTLARAERALRDRVLDACGDHLGPVVRGILNEGLSDDER